MGIKLEYRGFTFEFAKIPSSEELEERYRQRVESLQSASRKLQEDKIQPVGRDGFLPTTSLQERFWYMHEASGGGVALHISHIVWLGGDLDVKALEGAFATVIERHEILRTGFQRTEAGLAHVVDDGIRFHLDEIDVRAQYAEGGKAALHRTIGKVIDVPFELDEPPLIRGSILHLGPDLYALVMVMHHIAGDGWSLRLLLQEVLAFYKAGVERKEFEFPDLPIQFADFAAWQVSRREEAETASALSYWVEQLSDSEPLDLPTDRPRPATRSHRGATYRFDLPAETVTALRRFVEGRDATLFHVLLGAFQVLLARYSGTRDVSVGSVVSGRNRPEVEDLIGCFINNMVLRTDLGGGITVDGLMQRVRKTVTDAQANEVPFDWIVHELRRDRNIQETPLFRVMLIQDEFPDMRGEVAGLEILGSEPWYPGAHYDMTLFVEAGEAHIAFVLRYATEIFDESTIAALAASYLRILEQFVASPDRAVADLDILDVEAQDALIRRGRGPELAVGDRRIHQRFEERVAQAPESIALSFDGGSWTYAELNQRANRIAHALIERGVGPDTFVGVSVERTPQLLAALLGVMKAGGAYVALQPDFPPERFRYIAADARITTLVCTRATANEQAWDGDRVFIEDVEAAAQGESANPVVELDPENLAYVLYTSGTTGRPKGVEMRHGAVSALVAALEARELFDADSVVLWKTPYGFDVSVSEMYNTLVAGGRLVVTDDGMERDPERLVARIREQKVNTLRMVPTALHMLTDYDGFATCDTIEKVICAGEALTAEIAQRYFARVDGELYNLLGATETCVDTTFWRCEPTSDSPVVPVGAPLENYRVYVLDETLAAVPDGFDGELFVGGAGLGRGYHDMPGRTALSFVPELHGTAPGGRMYRTGDVVRWGASGQMEYRGRGDDQLQVRGIRVELGELEAHLMSAPGVGQAAVRATNEREGRADSLVAYIVPAGDEPISTSAIREHLQRHVQDAVIPSRYVELEAMPRTSSGKIDRGALPDPDVQLRVEDRVQPRNELERTLAKLWADHLDIDEVGIHENFFEIGGHSVTAIQIISKAKEHGLLLRPQQFFQHPTIARLSRVVEEVQPLPPQGELTGDAPLSPTQRAILARPAPRTRAEAMLFGLAERAEPDAVRRAVADLLRHHDALRLRYADGPTQTYAAPRREIVVDVLDLSDTEDVWFDACVREEVERLRGSLDLERGPIMRATTIDRGASTSVLVVVHELAVDAHSWRILGADLGRAIRSRSNGRHVVFPQKTHPYGTWTARLAQRGPGKGNAEAHWRDVAATFAARIPADSGDDVGIGGIASTQLDEAQTATLFEAAREAYNLEPDEVVLAALGSVLCEWSGDARAVVEIVGDLREVDLFSDRLDVSRTVGCFATRFPFVLRTGELEWPEEAVVTTKEERRAVPEEGLGWDPAAHAVAADVRFAWRGVVGGGGGDDVLRTEMFVASADDALVAVDAFVRDDQLVVQWSHSGQSVGADALRRQAERLRERLLELSAGLESVDGGRFTPSDFDGIGEDDFAALASLLGDD